MGDPITTKTEKKPQILKFNIRNKKNIMLNIKLNISSLDIILNILSITSYKSMIKTDFVR